MDPIEEEEIGGCHTRKLMSPSLLRIVKTARVKTNSLLKEPTLDKKMRSEKFRSRENACWVRLERKTKRQTRVPSTTEAQEDRNGK